MPGSFVLPPLQAEVCTQKGLISYTLTGKKVKNVNLRVRADGSVAVSAPPRMPREKIEEFLRSKAAWIQRAQQRAQAVPQAPPRYSKQQCLALFAPIIEQYFPVFSSFLCGKPPVLKVRDMKTRWGVCNPAARTITLNQRLAELPLPAQEYVVLHEYVHFLHPNHQSAFHAEIQRLMPDYRQRRRMLKQRTP